MKTGKIFGTLLLTGALVSILLQGCTTVLRQADRNPDLQAYVSPVPITEETQAPTVLTISPERTETYLTNPGMGWQDGPEPFGIMDFPDTVSYSNRRLIAWSILNPADGVYDWSALDAQLNQAVQNGKQFSFRIYTNVGEGYDGNMVPDWVLRKGATLLYGGEPDYSNCIYQEEWGKFVTELIRIYDGNPNIAFIDISGYGNFNEWSWQDNQTVWDERWMTDYENGTPTVNSFRTLDGQARRRLADIFIGGSIDRHTCRTSDGKNATVSYIYPGFQKTQLVMPYAGIIQASQYVYYRRSDVGFRHDCLGRDGRDLFDKVGPQILAVWRKAPVVYELCKPKYVDIEDASWLLQMTHASIVHNNNWSYSKDQLQDMMLNVGYRYYLKSADIQIDGRKLNLKMKWQNVGYAPSYPKMGQEFALYFYLLDSSSLPVDQEFIQVDISTWQPATDIQSEPTEYTVYYGFQTPSSLQRGTYQTGIAIIDKRTNQPINLSIDGRNENGIYILSPITIK